MFQMISALREVYHLSLIFALFLTMAAIFVCGRWWSLPWRIDLHDLSRHSRIEHDCSMCHGDAKLGHAYAPSHVSYRLLKRLLSMSTNKDSLTLDHFVEARIRRAWEDTKPLDSVHREIAHGEAALTMLILGQRPMPESPDTAITVPCSFVKEWFGGNRLPERWKRPEKEIGLLQAGRLSGAIRERIRARLERITLAA
jgi:hypothetical protein